MSFKEFLDGLGIDLSLDFLKSDKGILERLALNWYIITVVILGGGGQATFYKKRMVIPYKFKPEGSKHEYSIDKNGLYEDQKMLYTRIIFEVLKIRFFWILFNEGIDEPLAPIESTVSPRELWYVGHSRILRKALMEALKGGLNPRLIIILIVLLAVVIYYVYSGGRLF